MAWLLVRVIKSSVAVTVVVVVVAVVDDVVAVVLGANMRRCGSPQSVKQNGKRKLNENDNHHHH